MVLGKLTMPGRPANFDNSRAKAIALAIGAVGGSLGIFTLVYHFSALSLSGRRSNIDCQKAVKPKTTNQPIIIYIYCVCVCLRACVCVYRRL